MVTLLYNRPLRCESLYLVQSAVVYWVDKYLHTIYTLSSQYLQTIYTLSTHYLFTIYTLSTQCQYLVQSALVYWVQTPSLVSSENPSLEDNLETHGSSLSSATSSNQQPTPGRLSGSSGCSSWCRNRGKHTWNFSVFLKIKWINMMV